MTMKNPNQSGIGNRIAPPRFILFAIIALVVAPAAIWASDWRIGVMLGFDCAAAVFIISLIPLFRQSDVTAMREAARRNDANRAELLILTALVSLVLLVAIAAELAQRKEGYHALVMLIVATLALSWIFSNLVYALHYAHLYYSPAAKDGGDTGGIAFPDVDEPDYWDFTYYAFTLGMTFQTSDVEIRTRRFRRIATFHGFAAFVFNIGVVAFTVNILGSGG